MEKTGPIEKVYEAYSAIADERVTLTGDRNEAKVTSSNGTKTYTVTWADNAYTSNDNASYWQGYAGYPIIAVLMLQGRLTLDREAAALFAGVDWTELNKRHKRDYAAAVAEVVAERGYDAAKMETAASRVQEELRRLDITVKRGRLRPPKAQ